MRRPLGQDRRRVGTTRRRPRGAPGRRAPTTGGCDDGGASPRHLRYRRAAMEQRRLTDAAARRRRAALAGHQGDAATARELLEDDEPSVRATALGALARAGALHRSEVERGLGDADPGVRRRACEEAAGVLDVDLVPALRDPDSSVVEAAAWALGERGAAAA